MLKEFIEKILSLGAPNIKEINGIQFSDKTLHEIPREAKPITRPAPEKLPVKTLSGLVDFVKSKECVRWPMMYILVNEPDKVLVVTDPREDESRVKLFAAEADLPSIRYGSFMDQESMIIMLRSLFVMTDDTKALLTLISNIKEENVRTTSDSGAYQEVVAKTGVGVVGPVTVEPIQKLKPFRTFVEIDQPVSEFLFRLQPGKQGSGGPTMAIFEADGGAWRNTARGNVSAFLKEALKELPNVTVIQ